MTTKLCPQCNPPIPKEVNEDNFHRDKRRTSGFNPTCKVCANARQKRLRSKPKHLSEESLPEDKPQCGPFEKQCAQERGRRHVSHGFSIFKAV